ncbi:hypothetical protein P3T76_009223 [Phytophthora citrophthora]|uniref:Uncharacterized protein n=1 Tax=Phytophthora citrophthora TaxID=4793 RepID=A0AAD9GH69_9STRA|nr:hypothetical protein P3T76_009223 [Phytophthora citrophthora]
MERALLQDIGDAEQGTTGKSPVQLGTCIEKTGATLWPCMKPQTSYAEETSKASYSIEALRNLCRFVI